MDIFLFIVTILSMIVTAAIVHIVCKHAKLNALKTGIAFQPIKQTEAIFCNGQEQHKCIAQWYTIAALTLMIKGLIIFVLATTWKCRIFKGRFYSNTVTVMLFFSHIKQYIPVKLYKTAGNIHLFQIYGQLSLDQITLERNFLWDIVRVDWKEVFVTLNGTIIQFSISVKIPLRDKYRLRCMRKRSLLLHVMLRQGTSWYALDNIEYLLPTPHLDESDIKLQKMASDMIAAQHNCKGLLQFILLDDTVTINLEVMTLTGVHIYRKDRNCREKSFIPWEQGEYTSSSIFEKS